MGNATSQVELSSDKFQKPWTRQSQSFTTHIKKKRSFRKDKNTHLYPFGKSQTSLPPSPTLSDPIQTNDTMIIDGRRYQSINKKYMLPIDEQEQDRLVQVHFIYKIIFSGNFSAPVRDLLLGSATVSQPKRNSGDSADNWLIESLPPPRVLDVACGTATWSLEMATEFPNSQFYGIDISGCYPSDIKPANTFFSQCDVLSEKGFPYPDGYFDYIFMRQVYNCFSESDWIIIVKEINRVLKPGGYVEFRDVDPLIGNPGPYTNRYNQIYADRMKKSKGVNVNWNRHMFDYLQNYGDITDMHSQMGTLQFGISGPVGDTIHNAFRLALQSHRLFFEKEFSLEKGVDHHIDMLMKEAVESHSFLSYHQCWGRKSLFDIEKTTPGFNPKNGNHCVLNRKQSLANSMRSGIQLRRAPVPLNEGIVGEAYAATLDATQEIHSANLWSTDELGATLGKENVSDIDQFVEGFED